MMKLDLRGRGRPKNEGAWRLAWHIGRCHGGDVGAFCAASRLDPMMVDRLLSAELIPGDMIGVTLWACSHCAIAKRDFQRRLSGVRWYDQPLPRRGERLAA